MAGLLEELRLPWLLWNGRDVVRVAEGELDPTAAARRSGWGLVTAVMRNGSAGEGGVLVWDEVALRKVGRYLGWVGGS